MADAYDRADIEAVADCYDLPCAVYVEDDVVVFSNREELKDAMRVQCGKSYARGARKVVNRVVAESISKSHQFSAWVEWDHLDNEGHSLFTTNARYFCVAGEDGGLIIRLVELTQSPVNYSTEDFEWISRRRFAQA